MLKIRRPLGRLIFNMGIAIPGKTVFLIETAPSSLFTAVFHNNFSWALVVIMCKVWVLIKIGRFDELCISLQHSHRHNWLLVYVWTILEWMFPSLINHKPWFRQIMNHKGRTLSWDLIEILSRQLIIFIQWAFPFRPFWMLLDLRHSWFDAHWRAS